MFFGVFSMSANEMNHNDRLIGYELIRCLCHFDHFVWALGSLFMSWSNWSKSNPRKPEATEKCFVKSYCELMWTVSRCVSMYLLHRIVFHVWSSGALLELNVFKCLQDLQVLPGMLRQILWRSYVRSPSPWFMWFRITGMWPCLCLWDLNEFPVHGLFFGEIFLIQYYVQNCSIICSKNVSICSNVFEGCWGQGGLAWIAWCLRNVHESLKDSVELLAHSQNLHRRVGALGPSTLTRGSSEFQADQRSNCLPMSQRFAKCFFDFWRIFTFLAFHVKYPTSNRYLTEVILCFILL